MTIAKLTDTDLRVRDEVLRHLEWDPEIDASAIGVAAAGGVVTLTGYIDSYAAKLAAERSAKRVRGVRAVANDIDVRLKLARTDPEVATDIARALRLRDNVPDTIQATVHGGHVTLTGSVSWLFQKAEAERVTRHIAGVRGIHNHITVMPRATELDVRRRIIQALHRTADLDAHQIKVTIADRLAILSGDVGSWSQRDAAERAAAAAPGITAVENRITVEPAWQSPEDASEEIC